MKQTIYKYNLWLIGDKNIDGNGYSYNLSEDEGQRLMIMLSSKDCPKFVIIKNEMINVGSIKKLERIVNRVRGVRKYMLEETVSDGDGGWKKENVEREQETYLEEVRELTEKEIETQEEFDKFCGKNRDLKLLNK